MCTRWDVYAKYRRVRMSREISMMESCIDGSKCSLRSQYTGLRRLWIHRITKFAGPWLYVCRVHFGKLRYWHDHAARLPNLCKTTQLYWSNCFQYLRRKHDLKILCILASAYVPPRILPPEISFSQSKQKSMLLSSWEHKRTTQRTSVEDELFQKMCLLQDAQESTKKNSR